MFRYLKTTFVIATGVVAYASVGVDTAYLFAKDSLNPRIKPDLAVGCFAKTREGDVLGFTNSNLIESLPNSNLFLTHVDSVKTVFDKCEETFSENESRGFKSVRWVYWSEFKDETGMENVAIGAEQRDELTGQEVFFPLGNKTVAALAVEGMKEAESNVHSLNKVYMADDLSLSNGKRQIKKKIIEKNPDFAQDGWKRWGLDLVL